MAGLKDSHYRAMQAHGMSEAEIATDWEAFEADLLEEAAKDDLYEPPEPHFCESPSCLMTGRCVGWKDPGFNEPLDPNW